MKLQLAAKTFAIVAFAGLMLPACSSGEVEEVPPAAASNDAMPAPHATQPNASPSATDNSKAPEPEQSDSGDPAPAGVAEQLQFTSTLLADGAEFDGTSLAGADTILWFWAPWCPTCQAEAPKIAAASANLPDGVTIIGVPGQSDVDAMRGFTSKYGLDGLDHLVDEDGSLWANFDVAYQPAFALINDDGTVTTVPGSMSTEGILDAANQLATSE